METHERLLEKPMLMSKHDVFNAIFPKWEEDDSILVVAVVLKGIRINTKNLQRFAEKLAWEEVFAEEAAIE